MQCHRIRYALWGMVYLLLLTMTVGCMRSPRDKVAEAQQKLLQLEARGASDYLGDELEAVRRQLQAVQNEIAVNQKAVVDDALSRTIRRLDAAAVTFSNRYQIAEQRSSDLLSAFQLQIDILTDEIKRMPRSSYVDQNRYTAARHRLSATLKKLDYLQNCQREMAFNVVVDQAPALKDDMLAIAAFFNLESMVINQLPVLRTASTTTQQAVPALQEDRVALDSPTTETTPVSLFDKP